MCSRVLPLAAIRYAVKEKERKNRQLKSPLDDSDFKKKLSDYGELVVLGRKLVVDRALRNLKEKGVISRTTRSRELSKCVWKLVEKD